MGLDGNHGLTFIVLKLDGIYIWALAGDEKFQKGCSC